MEQFKGPKNARMKKQCEDNRWKNVRKSPLLNAKSQGIYSNNPKLNKDIYCVKIAIEKRLHKGRHYNLIMRLL